MPLTPAALRAKGEACRPVCGRAPDALEATLEDEGDVNEAREEIRGSLDLPEADDPVGALYEAVAASDAIVRATDGSPFTTLFNRFSIDNNRMLRNAAA